jgi:hypothetical protein
MKTILRTVFDNIFWPAAAGNVFWSFCNVVIDPQPGVLGVAAKLVVLILFSIYLTISWLRFRVAQGDQTYVGWFFDFLHLWAIVFAALATQITPEWLEALLVAYFFVTAMGHISGQWKLPEDERYLSLKLAAINASGILALLVGGYFGLPDEIRLPGSFALVFVLWLFLGRWKEIGRIDGKLASQGIR